MDVVLRDCASLLCGDEEQFDVSAVGEWFVFDFLVLQCWSLSLAT